MTELNFIKELRKSIITESDLQKGEIEFSYTGELVPFELVEDLFEEFIKRIRAKFCLCEVIDKECLICKEIDKLAGKSPTIKLIGTNNGRKN